MTEQAKEPAIIPHRLIGFFVESGRQWHNRDKGFGVCESCIDRISDKETPVDLLRNYGEAGVHYAIKEWSVWVGGVEANLFKLSRQQAEGMAQRYKDEGYDDVQMEMVK